jgi:protocatechuate 3,4-dioxygenase beta subunit
VTTIEGQVIDPQGRPIDDAAVYIVASPVSMPDIAQLTDDQGRFTISAPAPGRYTVGARSDRWGSAQTEVEVAGEGPVSVKVQLGA